MTRHDTDSDGTRWKMAVSQGSIVRLAGVASSYGVAVTSTTFVDDPFMQLSVLGYLPGTGAAAGAVFARQKLNLKGVSKDTVGVPIRRPLDWAGEVDPQLRTAVAGFAPVLDAASAYVIICLISSKCAMLTLAPGAPFRNALGTGDFAGCVFLDGVHEGFLEVFAQLAAGNPAIDPATDAAPPVLAKRTVEAGPTGSFSATVRLSLFDTH
jgi:hypothetical protein